MFNPCHDSSHGGPSTCEIERVHFCYNREQWSSTPLPLHHFQKSSRWELGMIMFVALQTVMSLCKVVKQGAVKLPFTPSAPSRQCMRGTLFMGLTLGMT